MLSKLGYIHKGGFANDTGRTAYLAYACGLNKFEKRLGRSATSNKTYPRKHTKKLPCEAL